MLDDFLFGVATSAYQIEGGWDEDGKVPSIWDEISHNRDTRFNVKNGHTGDIACNHYYEWEQDIGLMKELGIQAYRFSISWSRICTKDMCSNLKGIKFYQDLVHELKSNNIEPFVTLYHWDLPKWLNDLGGWSNPESIEYFKCYAETMFNALPEVRYWITFNEPAVFLPNFWGHNNLPKAIKNVLLAHGEVVKFYNSVKGLYSAPEDGKIGISLNLMPINAGFTPTAEKNLLAASNLDKIQNRIWLDPIYKGKFPEGINQLYGFKGEDELKLSKKEAKTVSQPIDFLGINYYTAATVEYNPYSPPGFFKGIPDPRAPRDETNTEIHPDGLYQLCNRLKRDYGDIKMYITENGCAYPDTFIHDKRIHDVERINYIRSHLRYCDKIIKEGIRLKGYFYWSLMDNMEWLEGYNKRFGLLYIFYPTQSRVCKDSFHFYKNIIKNKEFREKQLESF